MEWKGISRQLQWIEWYLPDVEAAKINDYVKHYNSSINLRLRILSILPPRVLIQTEDYSSLGTEMEILNKNKENTAFS